MIFACGVGFMRLISLLLKGNASGSARAARSMALTVIGRSPLRGFLGVGFFFMLCRSPG